MINYSEFVFSLTFQKQLELRMFLSWDINNDTVSRLFDEILRIINHLDFVFENISKHSELRIFLTV